MEPWMNERLEELRREQNRTQERPSLRLPVPPPPTRPTRPEREEGEREGERGVVVIDLSV